MTKFMIAFADCASVDYRPLPLKLDISGWAKGSHDVGKAGGRLEVPMSSASIQCKAVVYPSSDGKPMAETPEHVLLMVALISMLRCHFKPRRNIYVIGNIFL